MPRRSRPMFIAPLIPFLAVLGIFGLDALHGSRYLPALVVVWTTAMAALAVYIGREAVRAWKRRQR